jgi:hypothetical protein
MHGPSTTICMNWIDHWWRPNFLISEIILLQRQSSTRGTWARVRKARTKQVNRVCTLMQWFCEWYLMVPARQIFQIRQTRHGSGKANFSRSGRRGAFGPVHRLSYLRMISSALGCRARLDDCPRFYHRISGTGFLNLIFLENSYICILNH